MRPYTFTSIWTLRSPIAPVWDAIFDYQSWPEWWPAITRASRVTGGDADGVGEVIDFVFRTPVGYTLRFRTTVTRSVAPHELDGRSTGDLVGIGRWRLTAEDDTTVVRYQWDVRTTRRWMNALSIILRPLFVWSHDHVMKQGEAGLRRYLARRPAAATRART